MMKPRRHGSQRSQSVSGDQVKSRRARCPFAAADCRKTKAPAARTVTPRADRPPETAKEDRAEQEPGHECQRQGLAIHSSLSSCSSRMALSSLATQCHALRQPIARPATSSASVQGCCARIMLVQPDAERRAEQRRNGHRPADQAHHAEAEPDALRAVAPRLELTRGLRATSSGECRVSASAVVGGSSLMLEPAKRRMKSAFQFCHDRADALLVLVQRQKLLFHRLAQLSEVCFRPTPGARKRARPGRSSRAPLHRRPRRPRRRLASGRSECQAPTPRRSRAGVAAGRTSRRGVSATMRVTPVFSAKISNGRRILRSMRLSRLFFVWALPCSLPR